MSSEQLNELATALSKAQGEMRNAKLNRINPHFKSKFADLASIFDAVKEPFSKHGLSVAQITRMSETGFVLETRLMHASGQFIVSEYPLPLAADKPQQMGSALTYAKRYSLAAIAGISADEDDDANAAESTNGKSSYITEAQVKELRQLIDDTNSDVARFCKYIGVPSLVEIPIGKLKEAKDALLDVKKKKSSQEAAE